MMEKNIFIITLILCILSITVVAQTHDRTSNIGPLRKASVDDYNNFTNVGQIGLTITNFGILGEGWNNPDQPSCLYKRESDLLQDKVEHFPYAGLWVGGVVNGQKLVTTAIKDRVRTEPQGTGYEFSSSSSAIDTIIIKSSIETSKYFSPEAVSHQDFICDYNDFKDAPGHSPMGIKVHQESYAWSYSFADAFVIMDYTIFNESHLYDINGVGWDIKNMYVGLWADASVANMNYTSYYEPGGGFTWYDNQNGFDQSTYDSYEEDGQEYELERDIAFQYDVDGDNGYAQSYIGFRILGTDYVPRDYWDTYYRQWMWSRGENQEYPEYIMPEEDENRYDFMGNSVPKHQGEEGYTDLGYPNTAGSWMILLAAGPFGKHPDADSTNWVLKPGESVNVAIAITCAPWANSSLVDSDERREILHKNSDWAQTAYSGEDVNGNGFLEDSEDSDGDGILDRYILPAPPPSPIIKIIAESGKATIYWGRHPEEYEDPLTQRKDFEGYRIYARKKTSTSNKEWTLLQQYDLINDIGYNTGFKPIKISREESVIEENGIISHNYTIDNGDTAYFKIIEKDTMYYRYINQGIQSGWPDRNVYAITSYDQGDPETGLESLESSKLRNITYVVAGKKPQKTDFKQKVGVYPNPYKAHASWDGFGEREKMIWFYNLPAECEVTIFTLSGELVDKFKHYSQDYNGSDIGRLKDIGGGNKVVFSGGERAWDLVSKWDQAIATGLYIFAVEDLNTGKIQRGKFLIVK